MTAPTINVHSPACQEHDRDSPKIPHSVHLRELEMPDDRKILIDRRGIAFLCERKPEEFGGKRVTIVGFKTMAKACPVTAGYYDLKAWWRGDGANGGKASQLHGDVESVLGAER